MDLAAWLGELGLERYLEAFEANDIDAAILRTLDADDLRELGVASLGHRKRLLEAIAALAAPEPSAAVAAGEPATAGPDARGAERRQLTLMFVDLVGSTALAARLDPEDMGEVLRTYLERCTALVTRWDGHVAKYMGDGVLAYFGWPRAHEDDAERAVRAGLELALAVGAQSAGDGARLAARIGIATGQVVVGDLIGEGASREEAVVGETPNLAARLQGLAEPGSVVIAEATQRLVGGLFELADLGGHTLRGFDGPVRAWRVVCDSRAESRFAARSATGMTPFVGRQHELGMLLDRSEQAREGEGQVVLLSGEPGIGKSRLVHGLIERLADEPHTRLRFYCSPYHVNSALHPVIEQIERAAGFVADDPPERKLDRLEALLSQSTNDPGAVAPLFAALLSIPQGARYPPLNLPAQRQRELTMAAMVEQVGGLAARRPVLMVLEDAHWIDPTTTELFERLIERSQTLPVLMLITFRPEFAPPWTSYLHMTSLTLNRLGRRHSTEMIAAVAGGKPLPEAVLAQIWAKTEGVPLFVEELTKTVLESGLLEDRGDRYALTGPLPPLAIPATLQDSLMARLDRLAPVKEVAQIGAVIGREFSYRLLAALSPLDETALQEALSHLVGLELVFRRGTIPDAIYSFKHAFVQDAAYASLLKSKRQQLHGGVAKVLSEKFAGITTIGPEIIAHHLTEAGLSGEAIDYWQRAGDRAVERSANGEAIAHFTRGLALLTTLPDSPERMRREIAVQTALGAPLLAKKGFAAPEVGEAYSRALELCEQAGENILLSSALQGMSGYYIVRAELHLGREMAERCLALAQRSDDPALYLGAHHLLGAILGLMGEPHAACDHLRDAIALYNPVAHRAIALRYGADLGVFDRSLRAHFLWQAGYPDQALETAEAALRLADEVLHPFSQALALSFAAMVRQFRREAREAGETAVAAITICDARSFSYYQAWSNLIYGWSLAEEFHAEEGTARIRSGLEAMQGTGARLRHPYYLGLLAQAYSKTGEFEEASARLAEALALVETSDERWWQAELHRLRGELLLTCTGDGQAQACTCFERALDISRRQEAKSLELRAASSLARLRAAQGKRAEAHELLAPVYAWFTEGFETADLKDARALLDALR